MIYVVSYDLAPNIFRNVTPFHQELERTDEGRTWWHFLTNTWLIATWETQQQVFERLQPHVKPNDRLLIMGVTPDYSGFLPQEAWQWIQQQHAGGGFVRRNPMAAISLSNPQYAR